MPDWRIGFGLPSGIVVSAGATEFFTAIGGGPTGLTEANVELTARATYALSGLYIRVTKNSTTAASTLRCRVNGANGNQSLTIPAGTTGQFEDTVNSDTLADGDRFATSLVVGTGGSLTFTTSNYNLNSPSSDPFIGVSGDASVIDSLSQSVSLFGGLHPSGFSTGLAYTFRMPAIFTNLRVSIISNAADAASTARTIVNGSSGNLLVTVPAFTTGIFEDSVNSDVLASGDTANFLLSLPFGGNAVAFAYFAVKVAADGRVQGAGGAAGGSQAFATTTFAAIDTEDEFGVSVAETDVQVLSGVRIIATNLLAEITSNTVNGATEGAFRINETSTVLAVTIPASTSGTFENIVDEVSTSTPHPLALMLSTGGSSGTISPTYLGFQADQFPTPDLAEGQPGTAEWGIGRRVVAMAY